MPAESPKLPLPRVQLHEAVVDCTVHRKGGKKHSVTRAVGVWVHWSYDGGITFTPGAAGSLFLNN